MALSLLKVSPDFKLRQLSNMSQKWCPAESAPTTMALSGLSERIGWALCGISAAGAILCLEIFEVTPDEFGT